MSISTAVTPYSAGSTDQLGVTSWIHQLAFALIVAGAFCSPINWSVFGRLPLADFFFILAFLLQAPFMVQGLARAYALPLLPLTGCMLFVVNSIINVAMASPYAAPLFVAKLLYSFYLFPLLLAYTLFWNLRKVDIMLAAWLAGAALTAFVALASSYHIPVFGYIDPYAASGVRARGLSYHANALGYTSALTAPVAIYLLACYRHILIRLFAFVALALVLYGIQASGSRSSLLGLVAGVLVLVLVPGFLRGNRLWLYLMVFLGLAATLLLGYAVARGLGLPIADSIASSAVGRLLGLSHGAIASTNLRIQIALRSWADFVANPLFGIGYGAIRIAQSNVLSILQSGGLLGLTAFLTWLSGLFAAGIRVKVGLYHAVSAHYRLLWSVVVAGLVIWFVNTAFQPLLNDRNGYILVGVLFALNARVCMTLQRH